MHHSAVALRRQLLKLADDKSDGLCLRVRADSRLVECTSSDVGSLRAAGIDLFDRNRDVVDELREFQCSTS